jgi:hypothetical protein
MRVRNLVMLILSILLLAVFASAQAPSIVKAKIPFAFSVEGKVLSAGEYEFTEDPKDRVISVRGSGGVALAPIITRLAAGIHTTPQDSHIVFDKVGDSHILSEIWVPGEDGFMLHITKEKHAHRIIDTPK